MKQKQSSASEDINNYLTTATSLKHINKRKQIWSFININLTNKVSLLWLPITNILLFDNFMWVTFSWVMNPLRRCIAFSETLKPALFWPLVIMHTHIFLWCIMINIFYTFWRVINQAFQMKLDYSSVEVTKTYVSGAFLMMSIHQHFNYLGGLT